MARRKKKRKKAILTIGVEFLLALSANVRLNLLPYRIASAIGAGFGRVMYRVDRRHRWLVQDQLRQAFPTWTPERIQAALWTGNAIGILLDHNVGPPGGIFVNFFARQPVRRRVWRLSSVEPAHQCCPHLSSVSGTVAMSFMSSHRLRW